MIGTALERKAALMGGTVEQPPDLGEKHVMLRNGLWELRSKANHFQIREYGDKMLLGNGCFVPLPGTERAP